MMRSEVSQAPTVARSPWHSPVPYLFGGMAAMLGPIALVLLIIACSYWRVSSGYLDGDNNSSAAADRDIELGDANSDGKPKLPPPIFEEKVVVIMAGHQKPTFLATPIPSRASSFGSNSSGVAYVAG